MPHTKLTPVFQDLTPATKALPNTSNWYFTSVVSDISEEALPWLLAQGWQLNAATTDSSVNPPVTTYLMARTKMLHWNVVRSLLTDFTNSFNEGRWANDSRYEDIVNSWWEVLDKQQQEVDEYQDDQALGTTGYITLMLGEVDTIETEYEELEADWDSYDTGDRADALAELKVQWELAADSSQSEWDSMTSGLDLPAIIADVDLAMDDFQTAVEVFNDSYATLGATLLSDFETHRTLARSFLTDLGTTELARINEAFSNSLSAESQKLTDRGLYSSALTTDITARNTREKNEAIAELNDKLNREKLANEHTLYNEQYQMRLGGLEAAMKSVDASSRIVQMRLQHGQWSAEIRHKIASLNVESRLMLLSLREKYYRALLESISWESSRRMQIYDALVKVRMQQFEMRGRVHDKHFELMKYRLDERNNIAASLFGFVERRTDAYPDENGMAQLVTNLGETGASTWASA